MQEPYLLNIYIYISIGTYVYIKVQKTLISYTNQQILLHIGLFTQN